METRTDIPIPLRALQLSAALVLVSVALLLSGNWDYPHLHTILDTGMCLLSGVLAWHFRDASQAIRRPCLGWIGLSFGITSALELIHVLVTVEWSGSLLPIAQASGLLRPGTWPPAAYLLPVGIASSLWLMHRGVQRAAPFAPALLVLSAVLFALFNWLPRYTSPAILGITRPGLVFVPVLWALIGWRCWRLRSEDRTLAPLALMSAMLFLGHMAMLYSRAPHDPAAMVAHLQKVGGYLALLVSLLQMASRDLLERIRAERQLADLNERLEARILERTAELQSANERTFAMFATALDAIITMDHDGRIVEFNPAAERIFGYCRGEVIGHVLADIIIPPPLREAHHRGLTTYLATGEAKVLGRRIELTGMHSSGAPIAVELSINRMPGNGPPLFAGFLRDITERKEAEHKLQAQLAKLDLLGRTTRAIGERQDVHSILQVAIRSLEEDLPVDFASACLYEPAQQLLTVACVGVKSLPLATLLAMPEKARIQIDQNGLSRCVQGHLVYEPDITRLQSPFPLRLAGAGLGSLVAAPLVLESKVFGVIVVARRNIEQFTSSDCEFFRQLSEHLALAMHQAELYSALQRAYEELRQTQQSVMQQERLRVLGQLASGIAHDINNALSPAALYAQSLLERCSNLTSEEKDYLIVIQRAIEGVGGTVGRMREFYRQREPQLAYASVDLNRSLEQVVDLTRARWSTVPQERGIVIRIQTDLAADLPAVVGAESEIRDAFTNLILNAVDAMPEGGTLTLRTRTIESNQASVEVIDTGMGMDEATRAHCLEPFFTTKGERGTGLGLAMVYGTLERHGGEIQIDSEIGLGTSIRLIFPSMAAAVTSDDSVSLPTRQPLQPLRILCVDDDPIILKSLRDTLEQDGHEVIMADGGQRGIDIFRAACKLSERFAAVITDLGMPHVDGRSVALAVKSAAPDVPVILLTGWGHRLMTEEKPPCVDRILSKPPKLAALRLALTELTAQPAPGRRSTA